MIRLQPRSTLTDTLVPYTTLLRSRPAVAQRLAQVADEEIRVLVVAEERQIAGDADSQQHPVAVAARGLAGDRRRTEEHTSELQSLMRISYAVFCLKKKQKKQKKNEQTSTNNVTDKKTTQK